MKRITELKQAGLAYTSQHLKEIASYKAAGDKHWATRHEATVAGLLDYTKIGCTIWLGILKGKRAPYGSRLYEALAEEKVLKSVGLGGENGARSLRLYVALYVALGFAPMPGKTKHSNVFDVIVFNLHCFPHRRYWTMIAEALGLDDWYSAAWMMKLANEPVVKIEDDEAVPDYELLRDALKRIKADGENLPFPVPLQAEKSVKEPSPAELKVYGRRFRETERRVAKILSGEETFKGQAFDDASRPEPGRKKHQSGLHFGRSEVVLMDIQKFPRKNKIDCVITDPPWDYDAWREHRRAKMVQEEDPEKQLKIIVGIADIIVNELAAEKFAWYSFCPLNRVHEYASPLLDVFQKRWKEKCHFQVLVWDKIITPKQGAPEQYSYSAEAVLYFSTKALALHEKKKCPPSIFVERQDKATTLLHWKPLALIEKIMNMATYRNETVLDPFAGHGGVGIIGKKLGRAYQLIEAGRTPYRKVLDLLAK